MALVSPLTRATRRRHHAIVTESPGDTVTSTVGRVQFPLARTRPTPPSCIGGRGCGSGSGGSGYGAGAAVPAWAARAREGGLDAGREVYTRHYGTYEGGCVATMRTAFVSKSGWSGST